MNLNKFRYIKRNLEDYLVSEHPQIDLIAFYNDRYCNGLQDVKVQPMSDAGKLVGSINDNTDIEEFRWFDNWFIFDDDINKLISFNYLPTNILDIIVDLMLDDYINNDVDGYNQVEINFLKQLEQLKYD